MVNPIDVILTDKEIGIIIKSHNMLEGMNLIGKGLAWLGFWIGVGLVFG